MATTLTDEDIQAIAEEVYSLILQGSANSINYGDPESPMPPPETDAERAKYFLGVIHKDGEDEEAGNMTILDIFQSFGADAINAIDEYVDDSKKPEIDNYINDKAEDFDEHVEDKTEAFDTHADGKIAEATTAANNAVSAKNQAEAAKDDAETAEGNVETLKAQIEALISQLENTAQTKTVFPVMIEGEQFGLSVSVDGGDVIYTISEIEPEEETA